MKIQSNGYMHESTIAIELVPETDVEKTLLKALWKHGTMEVVYGPAFIIRQNPWPTVMTEKGEEWGSDERIIRSTIS